MDNKGMTMIEVLMGFTILIIFLAGMSGIIAFSNNVVMRSVDLKNDVEVIQGEMYKKSPMYDSGKVISSGIILKEINGDAIISLVKAKETVYESDYLKNNGVSISDEGLGITYYSIEAK